MRRISMKVQYDVPFFPRNSYLIPLTRLLATLSMSQFLFGNTLTYLEAR